MNPFSLPNTAAFNAAVYFLELKKGRKKGGYYDTPPMGPMVMVKFL